MLEFAICLPGRRSERHREAEAFENCDLTELDLPHSVTSLWPRAFAGNTNLAHLTVGHGLTHVPRSAIEIDRLQTVQIGDGLTDLGGFDNIHNPGTGPLTFLGATSLTHVALGTGITNIGYGAFAECTSLTQIVIPDHTRTIGMAAFRDTTALRNIDLGPGVQRIETSAFENSGVRQIAIPTNTAHLGSWAFSNTRQLTTVDLGSGLTSIGTGAFLSSGITNLHIPDNVTQIGAEAFNAATQLQDVVIGVGVTNIGSSAFRQTLQLQGIAVHSSNPAYESQDGYLYTKGGENLIQAPLGDGTTEVVLPGLITNIMPHSFSSHQTLTSVTIPGNVRTIGDWAFPFASYLAEAVFAEGVESIGSYAYAWTGLREVTIPASCAHIAPNAFHRTAINTNFFVHSANPSYSSPDGVPFNKEQTTLIQYPPGRSGPYGVPTSTVTIAARAFESARHLTEVTIPGSVQQIGDSAFLGATSLASVVIADGVRNIGSSAFRQCYSLTSVTLPGTITNLGNMAFHSSTRMQSLLFTGDAPALGSGALGNMPYLTVYRLPDTAGWPDSGESWGGPTTRMELPPIGTDGGLGMQNGKFGFNTGWANATSFVIEAASSLLLNDWKPVSTNDGTPATRRFEEQSIPGPTSRFYRAAMRSVSP